MAPSILIAGNQTAIEGAPKAFQLGQFSDPGDDSPWTVMVNWGDGSPPETYKVDHTGTLGDVTHTYGLEGSDTVSVEVTDSLGASSTRTFGVTVLNVSPTIESLTVTSPVSVDQDSALDLTFSDPGLLDTFRLLIQWGNHTSTFARLGVGTRSYSTSHAYSAAGSDAVTVTITDHGDGQATDAATVLVVAPAPVPVLSASPVNPAAPNPDFTTLAFFNSTSSKAITSMASPPSSSSTLFLPNLGQGSSSLKSPSGLGRGGSGKSGGRSLQELLTLLLKGSSTSSGGNLANAFATPRTGAGFSPSSGRMPVAASSSGPNQNLATQAQQSDQDEPELTHGRATPILMLVVWTLVFKKQRARVRLGRRTLGDRPPRPQ